MSQSLRLTPDQLVNKSCQRKFLLFETLERAFWEKELMRCMCVLDKRRGYINVYDRSYLIKIG